jgi:hypothetical protein
VYIECVIAGCVRECLPICGGLCASQNGGGLSLVHILGSGQQAGQSLSLEKTLLALKLGQEPSAETVVALRIERTHMGGLQR